MPTVCKITLDAAEYKKELDDVVSKTRSAQAQLSQSAAPGAGSAPAGSSGASGAGKLPEMENRTVEVKAVVTGLKEVQQLSETIRNLPDSKTITVKEQNPSPGNQPEIKPPKMDRTITVPAVNPGEKISGGLRGVWKEMTNLEGGSKKLVGSLVAGGGLIGIAMAGVQGAIKACVAIYDAWIAKGVEAAQMHRGNAESIAEAAANNEKLTAASNDYLAKLTELSNVENLSNAQKEQAVTLIARLNQAYGDLGITVDKTTGRIDGLGTAIVNKLEKDQRKKIKSLEAEIKELRNSSEAEGKNIDNAGFNVGKIVKNLSYFHPGGLISNITGNTDKLNEKTGLDQVQIGGEQSAKEASDRREAAQKTLREKQLELRETKKNLEKIRKDQLEKTRAGNAVLAEGKNQRDDQTAYRAADDAMSRMRNPDDKIANRRQLIEGEQARFTERKEKTDAAKRKMDAAKPDTQERADAERDYLQNAAQLAESQQKIYGWEQQIAQIKYEQAEGARKLTEQSDFELSYQKMILSGEFAKAAALKQEHDLKQQNLQLDPEKKKKLLDNREEMNKLDTQKKIAEGDEELRIQQAISNGEFDKAEAMRLQLEAKRQNKKYSEEELAAMQKQKKAQQDLQVKTELSNGAEELKIQKLLLAGEYEKAEVLRLQLEAKKQGRQMTDAEKKERLRQGEERKKSTLLGSQRDQAQNLVYQAMEQAGQGREAAQNKALADAEKTKGGKLSSEERSMTLKLAEMTWKLSSVEKPELGDLSIKTNSLTARGGFQGGAAMPSVKDVNGRIEDYTREIKQNLDALKNQLNTLNQTIKDGNRI